MSAGGQGGSEHHDFEHARQLSTTRARANSAQARRRVSSCRQTVGQPPALRAISNTRTDRRRRDESAGRAPTIGALLVRGLVEGVRRVRPRSPASPGPWSFRGRLLPPAPTDGSPQTANATRRAELARTLRELLSRRAVQVGGRGSVLAHANVASQRTEPSLALEVRIEHRQTGAINVHHTRGKDLVERRAPDGPKQVGRPLELIDQRRDGKVEAEAR